MNWTYLIQPIRTIIFLILTGIGLAGIPDDLQAWSKWLTTLDECGKRIFLSLMGVLILIGPGYYRQIRRWKNQRDTHEKRKHSFYLDANAILDFYIKDAIKDKRPKIKLGIRHGILETFENTCPDGMKGDGIYDGNILEHWIQNNAMKTLVNHYRELDVKNQPTNHKS